jgi:serine O-acetyltransferase
VVATNDGTTLDGTNSPFAVSSAGTADADERRAQLAALIWEYAGPLMPAIIRACGSGWQPVSQDLVDLVEGDLLALVHRDPAAHGSWREVMAGYRSFRAVLAYRLAHAILTTSQSRPACAEEARILARRISEQARVETGVELHPAARIGARFVVDHGVGTVVGETTVIGDDCYVLQCVVLGSTRIADNPSRERHPTLGDRVQVGAFARVLGAVTIGDDVEIGCHVLIREDVPSRSRVSVLHQYQVVDGLTNLTITGVEAVAPVRFRIHGVGLDDPSLSVSWVSGSHPARSTITVLERSAEGLLIDVPGATGGRRTQVRVHSPDGAGVTLLLPKLQLVRRTPAVPAAAGTP